MAQPGTDGIDVHPCTQQMRSGGVPDSVWAYTLALQRGHVLANGLGIAFHHGVNTIPCQGVSLAVEEDVIGIRTASDQAGKFLDGFVPERTMAQFAAFAANNH